jgi:hypothetical protein
MDSDHFYRRLARFYRGCAWVIGALLIVGGLMLFVHDLLICFHRLPPDNPEGPYGVILGPIVAMMGGGALFWLRYCREISVNDE